MKYSFCVLGQVAVASCPESGSTVACITPSGAEKGCVLRYAGSRTARFMNSPQMGPAVLPPVSPRLRLSSKPTQTTQSKFDVYPANQPSRDVPVFRPLSSKHIPSACARRYDADIHEIPHFVTIKDSEIDVEREEFNELFSSIVDAKLESSEAA